MASVLSVNVGTPRDAAWAEIGRTSIDKHPVHGPVVVRALGVDGDQVSDRRHHGGIDQAVYAFAREDLDWWEGELGREIRNGQFAENLTDRQAADAVRGRIDWKYCLGLALTDPGGSGPTYR